MSINLFFQINAMWSVPFAVAVAPLVASFGFHRILSILVVVGFS